MISGPQTAATNFPRGAELAVNWATELLEHLWSSDKGSVEATMTAEQSWFEHVAKMYEPFLLRKAQSWITGYNSNLDGHEYGKTRYNIYNGGGPKYADRLQEEAQAGYAGINIE